MWIEKYISREFLFTLFVMVLGSIAFFNGLIDQTTWMLMLGVSQGIFTTGQTVQKRNGAKKKGK